MNYIPNDRLFEDERVRIVSKMVEKDKVFIDLELVPKECYECPNYGSIEVLKMDISLSIQFYLLFLIIKIFVN